MSIFMWKIYDLIILSEIANKVTSFMNLFLVVHINSTFSAKVLHNYILFNFKTATRTYY